MPSPLFFDKGTNISAKRGRSSAKLRRHAKRRWPASWSGKRLGCCWAKAVVAENRTQKGVARFTEFAQQMVIRQ